LLKLLWIEVGGVYDNKAVAFDLPSVVFGTSKVLDLNSIFVEDVKAAERRREPALVGCARRAPI
jgi:hypothetical protein